LGFLVHFTSAVKTLSGRPNGLGYAFLAASA
jgi:hypothetical protein